MTSQLPGHLRDASGVRAWRPVRTRVRLRVRVYVREHHEKTRVAIHSNEFQVARQLVRGLSEKGSARTAIPTRVLGGAPKTRQEAAACFVQELAARQVVGGFPPMELVRFPSK